MPQIPADIPWPLCHPFKWENSLLLVIDMQIDFCGPGGWFDQLGIPLADARTAIEPVKALLSTARQYSLPIAHTRESYRPGGWDVADNVYWRTQRSGVAYGTEGTLGRVLTRGEPGWQIIEELAPLESEWVIDKPAKSAFYETELDMGLRQKGIQNLIICGLTTDVCVQTTLRDAFDLGYECLLIEDACGASKLSNHRAYIDLMQSASSRSGAVTDSTTLINYLQSECPANNE